MRFRVSLLRMPLLSPFSNSSSTVRARHALILQMDHGGIEAFSECVTDESPSFTGEDNETAMRAIKETFADKLLPDPPTPAGFIEAVKRVKGQVMAKASTEMLLWDYKAKCNNRPLDTELGESRGRAAAGIALGLGQERELRTRIERALERGYKRIKVKIERDGAFERLRRIRDAFPEIPLSADANGCFELGRDLAELKRIDKVGIAVHRAAAWLCRRRRPLDPRERDLDPHLPRRVGDQP